MTDERTELELRTWFAARFEPDVPESLRRFLAELPGDAPALTVVRPTGARPLRADRHAGALRLLVACAVVALIGVGLVYGLGQGPTPPVSLSPSPAPPRESPTALVSTPPSIAGTTTVLDAAPIDAKQGWALTDVDVVWTDDGGVTWRSIKPPPPSPDAQIRAVHFLDQDTGWVVSWSPDGGHVLPPADERRRRPLELVGRF